MRAARLGRVAILWRRLDESTIDAEVLARQESLHSRLSQNRIEELRRVGPQPVKPTPRDCQEPECNLEAGGLGIGAQAWGLSKKLRGRRSNDSRTAAARPRGSSRGVVLGTEWEQARDVRKNLQKEQGSVSRRSFEVVSPRVCSVSHQA